MFVDKKKQEPCSERIKKLPSKMGLFVNNQYVQTIMLFVTVYALIGDDIRILAFSKDHDEVF